MRRRHTLAKQGGVVEATSNHWKKGGSGQFCAKELLPQCRGNVTEAVWSLVFIGMHGIHTNAWCAMLFTN